MFIKICANTNLEDAELAAELGADAVGFVFATSKRQVTVEQVAEIVAELPVGVERVGVFDTTDAIQIEHHVVSAGLTVAQLHGTFDGAMVQELAAKFGGELNIIQTVAYAVDAAELERALALECECVGVNSRDLRTFEVSLDRACELAAKLPESAVRVAESGIHTQADMQRLRGAGYEAFLIGESLMRQSQPGEALANLLGDVAK